MKTIKPTIVLASLILFAPSLQAKIIVVNTTNNVSPGPGQTNLVQAIGLLADGDTIQFNIPGTSGQIFYIQTPSGGYPIITNNSVTIDGYSQPGAVPNSSPIHAPNNAKIKICLDSRNGDATDMGNIENIAGIPARYGFGHDEWAVLGVFRGTNAHIKGIAILSAPQNPTGTATIKSLSFARDYIGSCANWHVSGCWIGVDPADGQLKYIDDGAGHTNIAAPGIAIAAYRHRDSAGSNPVYPQPGIIGVAPGSTNPRAEFNVIETGYGFDSEGLNFRISGNFWGVLPDGMTNADFSVLLAGVQLGDGFIEIGRDVSNCIIGTDGDGVNDADEGNVFGGFAQAATSVMMNFYSSPHTNIVIAGNSFGLAVDGVTRFTNSAALLHSFASTATVQFGSDFDGVSDAWEANRVYDITNQVNTFFDGSGGSVNPGVRMSFRGNVTVNNEIVPYSYANDFASRLVNFTNYEAAYMDTNVEIIPKLDAVNIFPHLKGTFARGVAPYTNIIIDVYQLDQEGWNNGKTPALAELTDHATYTNGFAQGAKYVRSFNVTNSGSFDVDLTEADLGLGMATVTVNYSADPQGTHRGRVHTSNFSTPTVLLPGNVTSVGLTNIVPDTIFWFDTASALPRLGGYNPTPGSATPFGGSLEPYAGLLGDSTFLLSASSYAADGASMRFTAILQPVAGGPAKITDLFYDDSGRPYTNQINLSRQDGNPGRVAGDPRYGALNFMGGGEASLFAFPTFFNSDGRFNVSLPFYTYMQAGDARDACLQAFSLNPATLAQTMLCKAQDSAFGRSLANQTPPTGASANQLSRYGGHIQGLDNGNFVSVVEDRSRLLNASGNASVATIFRPDGSIVKDSFKVADADQWANVAAYRGGFAVRPSGGVIYFYDNAGNLQGSVNQNTSSGISFDTGRGDGTRIASDIRGHYVYLAGAPSSKGPVWLVAWDANTRTLVGKAVVTDSDPDLLSVDRVNLAVDAFDRVCVAYKLKPTPDFLQWQTAARVIGFDGTNFSYLTHTFFPFINHESDPTNIKGFITAEMTVAMTPRQIFIAAKGNINSTNNPAADPDTAANTDVYTVINQPVQLAAPRPQMSVTRAGANAIISWDADVGLFRLESSPSVSPTAWSNVSPQPPIVPVAGNRNTMTIPVGAGITYFRLTR